MISLTMTLGHIFNYSFLGKNQIHSKHHQDTNYHYGPDFMDHLFGTNYYDYEDGTTLFVVESSGFTPDWLVCSAITKNELLLNVIDEAEIQSNVFIERGKNSAFERVQRLGEVDNVGDLEKYGYGFFDIIKI
jgi:hypothetical protein